MSSGTNTRKPKLDQRLQCQFSIGLRQGPMLLGALGGNT